MDITPQELRDIEIREAWRGYHRDDVDELLERAAATIEHLEVEVNQLRSRGGGAPLPTPAAPIAATPQPAPAPVSPPVRTPETDVIQRTLVLAQKAADEAVAEAKTKAAQIVTESEERAQKLVAEAEASARRIADAEKARLEEDIARLTAARDTLTTDVDALEAFAQDYRDRLKVAIQAELDLLEAGVAGDPRPELHEVDLPDSGPSWSASQLGVTPDAAPVAAAPPIAAVPTSATPTVHIEAVPAYEAAAPEAAAPEAAAPEADWDPAPAGGWTEAGEDRIEVGLADTDDAEYVAQGDSLDDDAFFASLREAVRDDAPLGPAREREEDAAYFDEDDTEEHRRLFKRRR